MSADFISLLKKVPMRLYQLFMLLVFWTAEAQTTAILDAENKQAIPYATVVFKKEGKPVDGFYTSENGILELPSSEYDTAEISSLGYENKSVARHDIKAQLYLKPKAIELAEVIVSSAKDTLIGEYNFKKAKSQPIGTGHQLAVFIDNPAGRDVPLKALWLKLAKIKYTTVVRIYLCERKDYVQEYIEAGGETGSYESYIPAEALTAQNIITELKPENGNDAKIDLAKYELVLPKDGAFIVMEIIGHYNTLNQNVVKPAVKDITAIEVHKAVNDNYCQRLGITNLFWVNTNRWLRNDYEYMGSKPPRNTFVTPTMGVVIGI
ncbi:MAG: hypothetical protein CMP77_09385 [Flavobacterium sp.]|nr:hypothetical protein [Flavobacterium sp.]|tara:strand:- start:6739 stop:7701 length:963 start_codon:yes stop_codon:yes gene_type:complete